MHTFAHICTQYSKPIVEIQDMSLTVVCCLSLHVSARGWLAPPAADTWTAGEGALRPSSPSRICPSDDCPLGSRRSPKTWTSRITVAETMTSRRKRVLRATRVSRAKGPTLPSKCPKKCHNHNLIHTTSRHGCPTPIHCAKRDAHCQPSLYYRIADRSAAQTAAQGCRDHRPEDLCPIALQA